MAPKSGPISKSGPLTMTAAPRKTSFVSQSGPLTKTSAPVPEASPLSQSGPLTHVEPLPKSGSLTKGNLLPTSGPLTKGEPLPWGGPLLKSGPLLTGSGPYGSRVYPTDPTPLHFTQLHYPKVSFVLPPPVPNKKPRVCESFGSCCCCSVFATLCSLLFTVVLLAGLATLISWLVLRPIYLPGYSIEAMQILNFNVTQQGSLNAEIAYTVVASNPNGRIGMKYDVIDLETSYAGYVFGRSAIPAFSQGHRNVITFTSGFNAVNYLFVNPMIASNLQMDVERESVALHVNTAGKVRVKVGGLSSFAFRVHVDCGFTVKPPAENMAGSVITRTCHLTRP